jgi:hypothetical protein
MALFHWDGLVLHMANYHGILATGQALKNLLVAALPLPDLDGAEIALYRPEDFDMPMAFGISIHLYRVTNTAGIISRPFRVAPGGRRYLPSLLLDLHYLVTPWAPTAEKQYAVLGWAMRALDDSPGLNSGLLNYGLPSDDTFSTGEAVQIMLEPLSMADLGYIWESFKPNVQVSVAYVARMVALDSEVSVVDGRLVQTRAFDMGEAVAQ